MTITSRRQADHPGLMGSQMNMRNEFTQQCQAYLTVIKEREEVEYVKYVHYAQFITSRAGRPKDQFNPITKEEIKHMNFLLGTIVQEIREKAIACM